MRHRFVLVAFPFDDLSSTKVRPALCLTNAIGNYRHVVVAFVTSRVDTLETVHSDVVFLPSDQDFGVTGLRVGSRLRLHRLLTVPQDVVLRVLGRLPPEREPELREKISKLFEIG